MITIQSFYPFRSFLKVAQYFDDEKATVKIKSLTYEHEYDFEYKDVHEISTSLSVNGYQNNFGFWIVLASSFTLSLFCSYIYANPILLRIEQIAYIIGILLYISGYKKSPFINLTDRNDKPLTFIKETAKNKKLIQQAIEMIRIQNENFQEINAETPFSDENFAFEHFEFDYSNLQKTTDRFYKNRIIGSQKSLFKNNVYQVFYNQLNGKIYRGKAGIKISDMLFSISVFLISVFNGLILGFSVNPLINPLNFFYILGGLLVLSLLFNFLKQDIVGLYGKDGDVAYWTYVNKTNKDNIEKALDFVVSKAKDL